ncbi:alpha/beta hydrolase [Nibrella saemangeumensis]|uniref:Alpha/beta hydrolase n=1 Tax=Nibrella saemangeumensis TaxID=1084526 RepID=A0ABP8MJL5_9BACT
MKVTERNNVRITGNPAASQTILFAHGFGTDQTAWAEVAQAFADDYRLILFDMVGANEQTVRYFDPRKYNRLPVFAEDLLDIMDELQLRNVIFLGHSVGGMTGILAAIEEPDWFSRMVLLNASPRYVNDTGYTGGFDAETLEGIFEQMDSNYHAWASGFAHLTMQNANRPHLALAFARTLSAMRPDVALATARVIFYSDHRTDIEKLRQPTLLIQGNHDIAVSPQATHYLHDHIPDSCLAFIDSEGHFPHISDAGEVVRTIRPFLN